MTRTLLVLYFILAGMVSTVGAAQVTLPLGEQVGLDDAGAQLRRAFNAWEQSQVEGIPGEWTRMDIAPGESKRLGNDLFLILLKTDAPGERLMVIDNKGPQQADLEQGRETVVGPMSFILISESRPGRASEPAKLMVRSAEQRPALLDTRNEKSLVKINGLTDPARLVVSSPDSQALKFAERFVERLRDGETPEEAARAAQQAAPPKPMMGSTVENSEYLDPTNFALPDEYGGPYAAVVTLRLVRGDTESIGRLASSLAYDSSGRNPDDPRVTAQSGEQGGRVTYGSPGDRFQATLDILERNGKIDSESETFVRVPLGGDSHFDLYTGGRKLESSISAERRGKDSVLLQLWNQQGDWGTLGKLDTSVRVREGQTVLLARNNYSRQSESSSGVPILQDIPFLGPIFGASERESQTMDYALFGTVVLED